MKKCPYCAEEIQDDAIKCKHCKEWFRGKEANKQSDSTPESDPQSQLSLTDQSEQIVEIPKHISSIVTVDEEDEDESKYVSVKPKGKYGWGWFIFFVIYANSHNPAFSTQITFYNPAISLIENFYFVPLLLIYFWFRNRFLKKLTLGQKRWPAGLKAGILVYLIWIVLIVPTGIIDTKLKNADIKEIGQKYYEKANKMQQEEQQLIDSIIQEPKSFEELRSNSTKIDAVLAFADQKHDVSRAMFNDLKAIHGRDGEIGKKKIDVLTSLEAVGNRQFETQKNAWDALKKYYDSNNEAFFNEYAILLKDAEKLRSEYQALAKDAF